jgi:hypothetical protein
MADVYIAKQGVIQRTGRKLVVEIARDDNSVFLIAHHDGEEPKGIRLSRESLSYMMQMLEKLDTEVEAVEGKTVVLACEIP